MTTKHVFESSEGLVVKGLRGAIALNHDLCLHESSKSIYSRSQYNADVAVIAGGGAGHEPAYAGYTGRGMLAAGVSGDIFASPSSSQILTCIKLALGTQRLSKVLLIVNNYTGDRLNFGLAAEKARSLSSADGVPIEVETVVVADDVSLCDRPSLVGARGLAGNILVCKIIDSAAEAGYNLQELKTLGHAVSANLASIGVGLAHCHVPGRRVTDDENAIKDGVCELGLGLHNEPGVHRITIEKPERLIEDMLEQVLSSASRKGNARGDSEEAVNRKFVRRGEDQVVLFVNNLGGMSVLEMCAIVNEAVKQLVLLSSYMTSLNAPGFSLSLLNLTSIRKDCTSFNEKDVLSFIDALTTATAWAGVRSGWLPPDELDKVMNEHAGKEATLLRDFESQPAWSITNHRQLSWQELDFEPNRVRNGIRRACEAVLEVESDLTKFDTVVGDGDCGATFASGARAVLKVIENGLSRRFGPSEPAVVLSETCVNSMGGTSGALFGIYFASLANAFSSIDSSSKASITQGLQSAPLKALEALSVYTPARPGDRTLVDALHPFCYALAHGDDLGLAVGKAVAGAERTRGMQAKLGRATYVGKPEDEKELPPDPGAWGVATLLKGFEKGLREDF